VRGARGPANGEARKHGQKRGVKQLPPKKEQAREIEGPNNSGQRKRGGTGRYFHEWSRFEKREVRLPSGKSSYDISEFKTGGIPSGPSQREGEEDRHGRSGQKGGKPSTRQGKQKKKAKPENWGWF